jgi:hypothetical protein
MRASFLRTIFIIAGSFVSLVAFSQKQQVIIRVIQEKPSVLSEFQTELLLTRKSFKFQVMLQNVDGIYIFASIKDSVYRFTENSPIQDFKYLKLLELREGDIYNTNRELSLSETGWSYWYYKKDGEHPFNKRAIRIDTNRTVVTKVIRQLYDVNEGKTIKLSSVKSPLYLFIIAVAEYDASGQPVRELFRRKVKIDWEHDEDIDDDDDD